MSDSIKEKIANTFSGTAAVVFGAIYFILTQAALWGGIILHLLTVFMIYTRHGIIWALFGLVFPFASEAYMVVRTWMEVGFLNLYILLIGCVILLYVLPMLITLTTGGVFTLIEKIKEKKQ